MVTIPKETLLEYLNSYVYYRELEEQKLGYTGNSAIVAAAKQTIEAIHRGDIVLVK